jgi:hypothetical protein
LLLKALNEKNFMGTALTTFESILTFAIMFDFDFCPLYTLKK